VIKAFIFIHVAEEGPYLETGDSRFLCMRMSLKTIDPCDYFMFINGVLSEILWRVKGAEHF
jgi:hypothetical protein